jgi:cell division septation protein DedD
MTLQTIKNILDFGGCRYWGMLLLVTLVSGCASDLQTKVAGNLNSLSKDQTVAILPIETSESGQNEMANMFRQGLYANLKQSKFNLMEKYIVDGLLKQNKLDDPSGFLAINPMQFGEILGADAIVFSRINKVERSYFVVHSSIELSVSIQMVDTRTGEVLWRAEQTEQDFSGIGKIPTGITTALLAPIQFVTNKFNLRKMTSKMVDKLTALVKNPENAEKNSTFDKTVIAKNATTDLKKIEELQQLKAEWTRALDLEAENDPELLDNETQPVAKKKVLALKTLSLPPAPEEMGIVQVGASLSAKAHKGQVVDAEMAPLPNVPKPQIMPVSLNALKTTLATPTKTDGHSKHSQRKIKSGKSIKENVKPSTALFTVQVGAYKTKAYAQNLLSKLVKKGYNAFVTHNKVYRVQVDKFERKEDAVKLAQGIQQKEKLKNFVTTVQPG